MVTWIDGTCPSGINNKSRAAAHKWRVFDVRWDLSAPYVLWAGLAGGLFLSLGSHGADQLMVQRYLCARSQRHAARGSMVSPS